MKSLKAIIIACSLLSTVAYAQAPSSSASNAQTQQQSAQDTQTHGHHFFRNLIKQSRNSNACVGPVSYCNIFFGS